MNKFKVCLAFLAMTIAANAQAIRDKEGAIIRSDTLANTIYLCFTGHDHTDGFAHVLSVLRSHQIKASFFLTGDFIRSHPKLVKTIAKNGHFIGPHSNKHLLYCDWSKRDSLLYTPREIKKDILDNLEVLVRFGLRPRVFMPPFEWYNQKVVSLAQELGQTTVNFTPGTLSNADYTTPDMPNYRPSAQIMESIYFYEKSYGMNGFHLLLHPGVSPKRTDKFYMYLDQLLLYLKDRGYGFSRF